MNAPRSFFDAVDSDVLPLSPAVPRGASLAATHLGLAIARFEAARTFATRLAAQVALADALANFDAKLPGVVARGPQPVPTVTLRF